MIFSEYTDIIKIQGEQQMENQLNFEVVSDEELLTTSGGQNSQQGEGGGYGSSNDTWGGWNLPWSSFNGK